MPPVPEAAKQPHSMIESPPSFTVGRVFYLKGFSSTSINKLQFIIYKQTEALHSHFLQTLVMPFWAFLSKVVSLAFAHGALLGSVCTVCYGLKPPLWIAPGQP